MGKKEANFETAFLSLFPRPGLPPDCSAQGCSQSVTACLWHSTSPMLPSALVWDPFPVLQRNTLPPASVFPQLFSSFLTYTFLEEQYVGCRVQLCPVVHGSEATGTICVLHRAAPQRQHLTTDTQQSHIIRCSLTQFSSTADGKHQHDAARKD